MGIDLTDLVAREPVVLSALRTCNFRNTHEIDIFDRKPFMMLRFLSILLMVCPSIFVIGQCKTFRISSKGDTLNCVDKNDKKQGKWVIHVDEIRGESGYEEEGEFKDDKKEGTWKRFNLIGDLLALENYKWGMKDGVSQYFTINGLEHDETWRAVNPASPFDTVVVNDVTSPDKYEMKVIKLDPVAMRHGNFRYYNPETGIIIRTEYYLFDKLQTVQATKPKKNTEEEAEAKNPKPKEVQEFEKKIAKKRRVYIRTGEVKLP